VVTPSIEPARHAIPARRKRGGADAARPVADEFCEVRFFVVRVRDLTANFEPTPRSERIRRRRRLGDRYGGNSKEKRSACGDCFQPTTPLRCWICTLFISAV